MKQYSFSYLRTIILSFVLLIVFRQPCLAEQTVGLFKNAITSAGGYTLVRSMNSATAFLIDEYGREVHSWTDSQYTYWGTPYLRANGNLVRMANNVAPVTAHIVEFDWNGNKVWDWQSTDPSLVQHHDIEPLPNGNIIILARHRLSISDFAEAGRDTSGVRDTTMFGERLIEVRPSGATTGKIEWEWTVMDHLIQDFDPTKENFGAVEEHPELIDFNYGPKDANWLHCNSVEYSPAYDQIILSLRNLNEFWVIDHTTTTSEASGHVGGDRGKGGDILYRWGNPETYRAGGPTDKLLSWQHDAQIISPGLPGEGNFIVFNNGNDWLFSSVFEIASPADQFGNYPAPLPGSAHLPSAPLWTYTAEPPQSYYAYFISGCQRLANGNTLLCHGPTGAFREVDPAGNIVWQYQNPVGRFGSTTQGEPPIGVSTFRVYRYPESYPAFAGRDLSPTSAIELYPVTISGTKTSPENPSGTDIITINALLSSDIGIVSAEVIVDTGSGFFPIMLMDNGSFADKTAGDSWFAASLGLVSAQTEIEFYIQAVDDTLGITTDPPNPPETVYRFKVGYTCGNIDGVVVSGSPTDISDLTFIVEYIFGGGPSPRSRRCS